jgi:hypothetical protein
MLQGDAKLLHQTLFENTNLKKELKILDDEKTTSEEKFKNLSDQYLQLFNKFSLVNVRNLLI